MSYRVETPEDCTVVYGSVPISVMAAILNGAGEDAVTSNELQNILGATIVVGTPANLARLKAISDKPKIPTQYREKVGEGACSWVESGRVGLSSNFMLYTFTGFNALAWLKHRAAFDAPTIAHPHDPSDLSRCRLLLEAEPRFLERIGELAEASPAWESLAANWNQICTLMDEEAPDWRSPDCKSKASKTYALMRELISTRNAELSRERST